MKALIIDGYNVIHRVPALQHALARSLEAGREALLSYCGRWRDTRGDFTELHVVFDGDSSVDGLNNRTVRGVQVTYTRTGEDADDRIRGMLEDSPANRKCVVVTDDNELAAAARSRGGGLMSVAEFSGTLSRPARQAHGGERDETKSALTPEDERRINDDLRRAWGIPPASR
ncbi:MAG: NYN domain-containing protein [bacterium]